MKQRSLTFVSKICQWQVFVVLLMVLLCTNCNDSAKSKLAQSVQNFNEKSLPQQVAEGMEWTSLTYDETLGQVVFLYMFDEDFYDAGEICAAFAENQAVMKEQMASYIIEGVKSLDLDGASIKIVFGFSQSDTTCEILFTAEEIDQLVNNAFTHDAF